jgi:hypothetical protein
MFKPLVIMRYKFLANSSGSLQDDQPSRPATDLDRYTIEGEFGFHLGEDSIFFERRAKPNHE